MSKQELRLERSKYARGLILLGKIEKLRTRLNPSTYEYMMKDKAGYLDRLTRINEEMEMSD